MLTKMKNLSIEKTERSPKVYFDYIKHEMEISGEAYPENNDEFYRPIFESLHAYLTVENDVAINFKFRMIYFNSSSARMLMKIFELLDNTASNGRQVNIEWYYLEDDDTMKEFGEDYSEDIEHAIFKMKVQSEN